MSRATPVRSKCFGAGDLAGLLADYAPDIVVFRSFGFGGAGGVANGLAAIGPVFATVLAEFAAPDTRFEIRQQAIEGDYAYVVWEAETAANVYEFGSDTFVVRDGKIVAHSIAAKMDPK